MGKPSILTPSLSKNGIRFKSKFRVERLPPDLVFLLAENERYILHGAAYYTLAPLLDGTRDQDAVIAALDGQMPPIQVGYTLDRLRGKGYLDDDAPDSVDPAPLTVRLINLSAAPLEPLITLLHTQGIAVRADAADLDLVLVDAAHDPRLETINTAARPWVLVKLTGAVVWVGPAFMPESAPCWACLAWRIQHNYPLEAFLSARLGYAVAPPVTATIDPLALGILAHLLTDWRAGDRALIGQVCTVDMATLETDWHTLIARPNCPVCGDPALHSAEPIHLRSVPKHGADAGYRSDHPEVIYQRYRQHISSVCGIVTHLTRVSSPDMLYVYASGHNHARSFDHWQNFRRSLRSQSAGKGTTDLQARVSALCESIERYSGLFHGDEPRITAVYGDLPDAVHPAELLLFSERQYAERATWNATCPPHLVVPAPFAQERPIEWSPAWSLTHQTMRHVPTAYCYYDYALAADHVFCGSDSNGCAAGASLEDAILQGLLELVERDAVALWWYNRLQRPAFDLSSIDHPYLRAVETYFAANGRALWALDLTADLGIPAVVALSRRVDAPTEDIVLGFGAHLDPQIAALRAVTELNQSLPAALRDAAGAYHSESAWEIAWWQGVRVVDHPYLVPDSTQRARTPADYTTPHTHDLRDDVLWCVEQLRARALELLVIDQTRADTGLPVARVIVPGLRHFWARFAAGRLYDVPVALGWLNAPTPESELNDQVMFL